MIELYAALEDDVSEEACKTISFLICAFTYTSIGYLVEIASESSRSMSYLNQGYVDWMSSFIWMILPPIIGFPVAAAPLLEWGSYGITNNQFCGFDFTNEFSYSKIYFAFIATSLFLIPLIVTSGTFVYLSRNINRTEVSNVRYLIPQGMLYCKGKSIISSMFSAWIYFVSWIPYTVVCVMYYFDQDVPARFESISSYVSKSATINSPLVYYFLEKLTSTQRSTKRSKRLESTMTMQSDM